VKPKLHIHKECGPRFHDSAPHLLHSGLSDSPIKWRCLLRVLHPVRRPVTALDCILLKDRNLALAPRQSPNISSQACLWVSPRPCHPAQCWLTNQWLILHIFCLETPKAGSGPWNHRAEPSLASLSAISFPHTSACTGTQYSPTACWVEISFNVFWHCWTNGDVVMTVWRAFKAAWSHGDYCMWHSVTENNLLQDTNIWYDATATNQNIILQNKVISHAIL